MEIIHHTSTSPLSRSTVWSSERKINRKVRPHSKSRQGCGNCKLRKVKCDEGKPGCKKCIAFGVFCSYNSKISDLQLSADGALNIEILQPPCSLSQTISGPITPSLWANSSGSGETTALCQLGEHDLELLSKFQTRTVLTIVNRERGLHIYQNEVVKLACKHPFLMHAVLALTLMHDRHLSATSRGKLSNTEAFQWYQSIALFNSKLSGPIESSERDPLWATAVFLGLIAVYYIEADTAEQAWPLKPSSSLDLNWLKMSQGKKEIWKITQPLRSESVFRPLVMDNMSFIPEPSTLLGLEVLPPDLIKLCGLDAFSTVDNNPYHAAASALAQVLNFDDKLLTLMIFLQFINSMRQDYKRLLELKDSCALLLLAYWYAKVCQTQQWWLWHRAALEGQAICMYLGRKHRHDADIQNLLQFPSMNCSNFAR